MALTTYTELKTAIGNWMDRGSVLTSVIPDLISLAEVEINNSLRARAMIASTTITTSTSYNYAALPTKFNEIISFIDDQGEVLQPVSMAGLRGLRYSRSAQRPEYYSITSRIEFDAVSDQVYTFNLDYYKRLDLASTETNDILTKYPNLYLFGSLIAAEPYLKNDARMATWISMFQQTLTTANLIETKENRILRSDFPSNKSFDFNRGF